MNYNVFMYTLVKSRRSSILDSTDYNKLLELKPSEMLVYLKDKDKVYKTLIDNYSVYFPSDKLLDFITQNAIPYEYGQLKSHNDKFLSSALIKKILNVFAFKYYLHNIRLYFMADIEKIDFNTIKLWLYDIHPLDLEFMEYAFSRGLPNILMKKIKIPNSVREKVIKAYQDKDIGSISYELYMYFIKEINKIKLPYMEKVKQWETINYKMNDNLLHNIEGKGEKEDKIEEWYSYRSKMYGEFVNMYLYKVNSILSVIGYLMIKEAQAINIRLISKKNIFSMSDEEIQKRIVYIR